MNRFFPPMAVCLALLAGPAVAQEATFGPLIDAPALAEAQESLDPLILDIRPGKVEDTEETHFEPAISRARCMHPTTCFAAPRRTPASS